MKKSYPLLMGLIFLCSCSMSRVMMNAQQFDELSVGMSWKEVQERVGEPVEIRSCEEGGFEAIYLEREGDGLSRALRYTLKIENQLLVSKDMDQVQSDGANF